MSEWKSIKEDGLPKVGDCLIVTIFDHCRNRRELRYPVYYLQHTYYDGYGFYFGDTSNLLMPEYSEVLAWQNIPDIYGGE